MSIREEKEVACFGMTEAEVEEEFKTTSFSEDRLMFAMCILSDAQEELVRGNAETARQWINKAKYHIGTAKTAARGGK